MSDHTATLFRRLQHTPLRDAIRGRLTARLDLEKLFAESEAPREAVDCVRRVVRKARLWRAERVEVAEELLAHFIDARAAGTPPEEAIEQFGDEKRAARLIRRAKRRQRPLAWHAWRVMMWSITALLLSYVGLWVYFWTGTPTPTVDYLAMMNARVGLVLEEQPAWPVYARISQNLEIDNLSAELTEFWRFSGTPIDHPDWPLIDRWLTAHQTDIDCIREATTLWSLGVQLYHPPGTVPGRPSGFADLPPLFGVGHMHTTLKFDAFAAIKEQDSARLIRDVDAISRLARQIIELPDVWAQSQARALDDSISSLVGLVLQRTPRMLSDLQLQSLAHKISKVNPMNSVAIGLEHERLKALDLIQHVYTNDGHGDGRITLKGWEMLSPDTTGRRSGCGGSTFALGLDRWLYMHGLGKATYLTVKPARLASFPSREEATSLLTNYFNAMQARLAIPPWELYAPEAERPAHVPEVHPEEWYQFHLLTKHVPGMEGMHTRALMSQATQSALLAAIALELYRRDHDAFPAALDNLTPTYLPAVPPDPMTGEPLRYRVYEGQPIIYSVGADLDDDGGRAPLGNDEHPEPIRASNFFAEPPSENAMRICEGDWVLYPVFDIPKIEKSE